MKKSVLFFALAVIMIGCNLSGYKHTKSGLYYKIIPSGKKEPLKPGQYVKLHVMAYVHDSLFYNTHEKMPQYGMVDTVNQRYDFNEILRYMGAGDSAVTIQAIDSLLKLPNVQLPPFFKKGDKLKTTLRIIKVFDSVSVAQADYANEQAIFKEKEDAKNMAQFEKTEKELADYLAKNKINATKTASGVYVEVKQAGNGTLAENGKQAGVKYRGTLLNGKMFDSNMEPGRNDTLRFIVGGPGIIAGFSEGISGQKLGSKLNIYIPAKLGYGAAGNGDIPPFSNLIFNLDLVEVKDNKPVEQPVGPVKK